MTELATGRLKASPEDFVVDELPAYGPSGSGEHLWLAIRKRDKNTLDAVRAIANALGADVRQAGHAGMKDKFAVTTQALTLLRPPKLDRGSFETAARQLQLDGIDITEVSWHDNKLKPGHLKGNRFDIRIRDVKLTDANLAMATLRKCGQEGVPNFYGDQRFGREGDNAARALAWLRGEERGPRDMRQRQFLFSALQSHVFNRVLQARIDDGTWNMPIEGDLLKKHETGGLFTCVDVEADRARALTGELSPTGPMFGTKMRSADGGAKTLEDAIIQRELGENFPLTETSKWGEGTRRILRMWVQELTVETESNDSEGPGDPSKTTVRVRFVLPKGAYATTVLASAFAFPSTLASTETPTFASEPDSDR